MTNNNITFGDFHTDNFVSITHGIGDYRGALQFNIDSITGNFFDLVDFFFDHCSPYGTPDKDFWCDPDLVKQAWADHYKFNVSTTTAYDLTDKADKFLAKFKALADFYRDLYSHKRSLTSIDNMAHKLGLTYNGGH